MTHPEEIGELLAVIDRLEALLERSSLSELEVSAGDTTLVLRRPSALSSVVVASDSRATPTPDPPPGESHASSPSAGPAAPSGLHAVRAPLTCVFYLSPSPGAAPYVRVGGEVNAGQVIGLIEAMKLFNEIKSDVTGTVRAISAPDGSLVKARQALIEVEPS